MTEPSFTDSDLNTFFKVRKTVLKMLEDRGYFVSNEEKEKKLEEWKETNRKDNLFCFLSSKLNDGDDFIFVETNTSPKLGVGDVSSFAERLHSQGVKNGIMIIRGSITALAKQKISELEELLHLEYFQDKELLVNITEHELVPKHYPLSDEEKKELLKKYRLRDYQLPKILVSDPIARYLGLKKGNVVKIVRPSETAGRYVTYRIAI